jgi:succinoglycan biosynthesis protein ExoV
VPIGVRKLHIFGSGSDLTNNKIEWLKKFECAVHFVRGPLTARNWDCKGKSLTDGALLLYQTSLRDLPNIKSKKVGYIPHHCSSNNANFQKICESADIEFIDVRTKNIQKFISQVKSCDYIIAEALHGAIVADIFRKPWVAIKSSAYINEFKWTDWCMSLNLSYAPKSIEPIMTKGIRDIVRLENILKRGAAYLHLGRARWSYKRILFDSVVKEHLITEQLMSIKNNANWILSADNVIDRLINQTGNTWTKFLSRLS